MGEFHGTGEVAQVFEETLREEKEANETLTQAASEILSEVGESEGSGVEAETQEQTTSAGRKRAAKSAPQRSTRRRAG